MPVVAILPMDPATPEKQESPGASAPVEAMCEPYVPSQPVIDISVTGPTTPPGQKTHDVSAGEDAALESQSILTVAIAVPTTPQMQKSPNSPPLRDIDLVSLTLPVSEYIRDLTMELLVQRLTIALRELITNSAFVMGCTASYHTHFTPPMDKIRQEISAMADPTVKDVADVTTNIMLAEWGKQCGSVISRYKTQMRRDMMRDARKESEALKPSVLAAVDAKIRALEEHEQENQRQPTTPTVTTRARPKTPTVDNIDSPFRNIEIRRPETPTIIRCTKSPVVTTPSLTAPPHLACSNNPRSITSRRGTPSKSPVKVGAPSGHKRAGMLGPHHVVTPIDRSKSPPRCKFNLED
ncbi:hypothetical protein CIB48_g11202 [Xylaria polymorpha]|nr:hypothetical protein CIB48_g11202 [Xylaria polymorpha]